MFLPEPFTGFRAMRAGLLTSTFLEVMAVRQLKASFAHLEVAAETQAEVRAGLQRVAQALRQRPWA